MQETITRVDLLADAGDLPGLVGKLQPTIRKAVNFHIYKGYFQPDSADDIIQDISLLLLEKGAGIIQNFKGNSSFQTYLNAVIFNFCSDLYRRKKYPKNISEPIENVTDPSVQPIPKRILDDEYRKLNLLLDLFGKKKFRLIICLKLTYKLPVSASDLYNYDGSVSTKEVQEILKLSDLTNVRVKDKQIFETLNGIFNRVEGKVTSIDSLRKWVDLKTDEMIGFMNGEPPVASYNRESLQILVEKYFMRNTK